MLVQAGGQILVVGANRALQLPLLGVLYMISLHVTNKMADHETVE